MEIDKTISTGNIISWIVLLVGLGTGYGLHTSATTHNSKEIAEIKSYMAEIKSASTKEVKEAKELASAATEAVRVADAARQTQINTLTVQVAETNVTIKFMNEKLDELVKASRKQ